MKSISAIHPAITENTEYLLVNFSEEMKSVAPELCLSEGKIC